MPPSDKKKVIYLWYVHRWQKPHGMHLHRVTGYSSDSADYDPVALCGKGCKDSNLWILFTTRCRTCTRVYVDRVLKGDIHDGA